MKLYTEEQVKKMLDLARFTYNSEDKILLSQKPILLPSDEEIEKESNNEYQEQKQSYENSVEMFPIDFANYLKVGFIDGAKWMRNKLQGDKE